MTIRTLKSMAVGMAVLVGLLLAGCSAHALRVECEGPLLPINVIPPTASTSAPVALGDGR